MFLTKKISRKIEGKGNLNGDAIKNKKKLFKTYGHKCVALKLCSALPTNKILNVPSEVRCNRNYYE